MAQDRVNKFVDSLRDRQTLSPVRVPGAERSVAPESGALPQAPGVNTESLSKSLRGRLATIRPGFEILPVKRNALLADITGRMLRRV